MRASHNLRSGLLRIAAEPYLRLFQLILQPLLIRSLLAILQHEVGILRLEYEAQWRFNLLRLERWLPPVPVWWAASGLKMRCVSASAAARQAWVLQRPRSSYTWWVC